MMATIEKLKEYFKTGAKPTQEQFHALIDSYIHKEEDMDYLFGKMLGSTYMGNAMPGDVPPVTTQKIFYTATTAGKYTNFAGFVIEEGEKAILVYDKAWSKITLSVLAQELGDSKEVAVSQKVVKDELKKVNDVIKDQVVQEFGDSTKTIISQKVVTERFEEVDNAIGEAETLANTKMPKQDDAEDGNIAVFENGTAVDGKIQAKNIAQQNGYYEGMVVGASRSLAGDNEVRAEYVFRPSGGTDIQSGTASINRVLGKTLVWNQLVATSKSENRNGVTINYTKNGIIINGTPTNIFYIGIGGAVNKNNNGHKFFIKFSADSYYKNDGSVRFVTYNLNIDNVYNEKFFSQETKKIVTLSFDVKDNYGMMATDVTESFNNFKLNYQLFDLTQMFGEGNEPTTVEEFEAMFPNDYYEYNEGTLISNDAVGIKSVGFNAWDEETERGIVDGNGTEADADCYRSFFIPILPNTKYYISSNNPTHYPNRDTIRIRFYDMDKRYLDKDGPVSANNYFTTPTDAHYMKLCSYYYAQPPLPTYTKGDLCINLSHSGIRDGEYKPYEEHKLLFNKGNKLSAIKGKLNGEGESIVVFPDGLRSAGNVRDEIVGNVAIKRIGAVDMGTLSWSYNNNGFIGETGCPQNGTYVFKGITAKYPYKGTYSIVDDKQMGYIYFANIFIKDSSYTDATTFKQSLQGQILYYELAEPETYILDEAVPMNYVVDDWGTEQRLVADENEVLAPLCYDVTYAINAVDTIRNMPKNYISEETMQAFLSAVGSAMGGTWNMTWNEDMEKYVFTFAPNAVATDVE